MEIRDLLLSFIQLLKQLSQKAFRGNAWKGSLTRVSLMIHGFSSRENANAENFAHDPIGTKTFRPVHVVGSQPCSE